jgi:hypothetical protein
MMGTGWVNGHIVYYYYGEKLDSHCQPVDNNLYGMTFPAPVQTGCGSPACILQFRNSSTAPRGKVRSLVAAVDCDETMDERCRHRLDPTLAVQGWAGAISATPPEFQFLNRVFKVEEKFFKITLDSGDIHVKACKITPNITDTPNLGGKFPRNFGLGLEYSPAAAPAGEVNVDPGSGPKSGGGSFAYLAKKDNVHYHILTLTPVQ